MGKIEFNYNQSIAQARKLDDLAEDLKNMLRGTYATAAENIRGAWKGDNADRFLVKLEELREQINSTAKYLETLARSIRSAASTIYKAEKRAEELARNRSFGGGSGGGGGR
ncbi:MAG: WXG100 family type VII secretion target [Ruminococcaceae bacterium]|nr:WXG100 family type VII secretion target [Oscillospiraceae bacterium]